MNGELAGDMNPRMNTQKHQMIDVSQEKNAISTAENALKPFKFHLSDLMPAVCKLQEYKKKLEADCSLLRAAIAAKEEHKTLQLKVESYSEIFEKQRIAAEEILKPKAREEEESQAQLSEVEEKVNTAAKEVQNYEQKIKAMEEKLQAAECSFSEQITPHEKKAHDTWLKAHALERALVQQAREAEYLKYRLEILQTKKPQEEGGVKTWVPGRPDMDHPPQRGPGAAPLWSNSCRSSFPARETEKGKTPLPRPEGSASPRRPSLAAPEEAVNMAARGPPPFPGPPFMHYPVGCPPPPLLRCRPPPPPWGPLGPPPPLHPPPFELQYLLFSSLVSSRTTNKEVRMDNIIPRNQESLQLQARESQPYGTEAPLNQRWSGHHHPRILKIGEQTMD
ncbi:transport and Golgi organization protein 1 homolog isoform X2 [Dasypus novemcinctus]|uniref:transport and Golgi organization protein 1 homolog isoform X2 n=1 Tax=Dasypus novemcinctus TaxID=9361 RepID=UPI00265E420A|nr:transport and Golgi organization protein 1 homolog isoform X2 [Dasypus novemcinctus]